ncbi:hypothetical protein BD309DRAFT_949382 [Dichomitus squalens]|nr:hypothetical protein BD309DRAFT_949382 [Dichomitus squalens]
MPFAPVTLSVPIFCCIFFPFVHATTALAFLVVDRRSVCCLSYVCATALLIIAHYDPGLMLCKSLDGRI